MYPLRNKRQCSISRRFSGILTVLTISVMWRPTFNAEFFTPRQMETCQWGGGNTNCFGESLHARIRNTRAPQFETCQWGGGTTNCFGESRHARIRKLTPPQMETCQWGVAIRIASERAVTPESVTSLTPPQIKTCQWGGGNTNCFGESRHASIRNTRQPQMETYQWGAGNTNCFGESRHGIIP